MEWPGQILLTALKKSVDTGIIDKFDKFKVLVDRDTKIYLYKDNLRVELLPEYLHGTNKISEVCNIIIYLMTDEFVDINENSVGKRLNLLLDLFNTCSKKLKSDKNYEDDRLFVGKVRHVIRFSMYPYFYSAEMLEGLEMKKYEPNKKNLIRCNELWKKYGGPDKSKRFASVNRED